MIIEEIMVKHAIDFSPHHHAYLNPYNGCPMGCPSCFWLSREGWEGRIQVRKNIAVHLKEYLENSWDGSLLYLGSICDPFMALEKKYGVTGECLELLNEYQVPLLITTSAADDTVLNYLPVFESMKSRLTIVVELSRIPLIEEMNRGRCHKGIVNANLLMEADITTWTTLSPVLPGITDLGKVLKLLHPSIPVYVDRLVCEPGGIQQKKVMEWIQREYPDLAGQYEAIVMAGDDRYYKELLQKYWNNTRVRTFPFKI